MKAVSIRKWACLFAPVVAAALVGVWTSGHLRSAEPTRNVETVAPVGATSYARVDTDEPFAAVVQRMQAQKEQILSRHRQLLEERYDLSNRPLPGAVMSRGKPIQAGPRVKLPPGLTWEQLAEMSPEVIKQKGLWPKGFLPLPHPNHDEGGMLFPQHHI
ncbi:MAG TPA: hypothetical protein PL064_11420, partial [Thermogutta sp.]|nr:hypothetical protein [Thermogutta sp.]